MPSIKKKSSKPSICPCCGGVDLVRKITTYPVLLSGPLEGKQIHIGRVALHECLTCGHLLPTAAGQAKVDRMSIWASTCSADNCTDRLPPPLAAHTGLPKLTENCPAVRNSGCWNYRGGTR